MNRHSGEPKRASANRQLDLASNFFPSQQQEITVSSSGARFWTAGQLRD
jgi:hypothetical protein